MLIRKHLLIGGKWLEAKRYEPLRSPYSGEVIAEIPSADEAETDCAIQTAYAARAAMSRLSAHERAAILEKLALALEQRKAEAARIVALEAAKPISIAAGEVARTIQTYKFAAEEAKRIHGETIPMDAAPGGEGKIAYTTRHPLGVIGAITPFNFPLNLVAHKVGPAIAAGNTVVLKPASQTPLSAFFIGELLMEAGLPAGALNIVPGPGSVVGNRIVEDDRVAMVTFTGSPEVGIGIRAKAGLKRVTLELGSNAALIVDQGVDLAPMIGRCVFGAFSNQGQVCISLQRIYVHETLFEAFTNAFVEKTRQLHIGDPLNPRTDISAMISGKESGRALAWIEEAKAAGAVVVAGGTLQDGMLEPTVITHAAPELKVSCQEVFAPIVILNPVSSLEDAFEQVNDSRYGLQAGIYTNDIHAALKAAEVLHVGGVIINDIPTFRVDHMPYGGVKESGTGREGVKYAVAEMTELKLIVLNRFI